MMGTFDGTVALKSAQAIRLHEITQLEANSFSCVLPNIKVSGHIKDRLCNF